MDSSIKVCPSCKRLTGQPVQVYQARDNLNVKIGNNIIFDGCCLCLTDLILSARSYGILIGDPKNQVDDYCSCPKEILLVKGCPRKQGHKLCINEKLITWN